MNKPIPIIASERLLPVNDPDDMRRLIDWGVDGLITDYPDRALRILGTP